MSNLLWFVINGSRLIVCNAPYLVVVDCESHSVIIRTQYQFVGLSKDETLIAVADYSDQISIWSIVDGTQLSISPEIVASFASHQTIRPQLRVLGQIDFRDIFTGSLSFAVKAPLRNSGDFPHFAWWEFSFPGQPHFFKSVSYDSDWGETYCLWHFNIISRKWMHKWSHRESEKPLITLLPHENSIMILSEGNLIHFSLDTGIEIFRNPLPTQVNAFAFHSSNLRQLFVADEESVHVLRVNREDNVEIVFEKHNYIMQSKVQAMVIDPSESCICLLVQEENLSFLQFHTFNTTELLATIEVNT